MPNELHPPFKVAVVQATPVFLDRTATIEKACELIACAGHYARPDVFELIVHTEVRHMLKQVDVRGESEAEGGLNFL